MSRRRSRRDPQKESFWRDRIGQQQQSGLNVRQFCRKHQLSENNFHAGKRTLAQREEEANSHAKADARRSPGDNNATARVGRPSRTQGRLADPPKAAFVPEEALKGQMLGFPVVGIKTLQAALRLTQPTCTRSRSRRRSLSRHDPADDQSNSRTQHQHGAGFETPSEWDSTGEVKVCVHHGVFVTP